MRLRATVTATVGALCPFGKARFTSPAMRPLPGSSLMSAYGTQLPTSAMQRGLSVLGGIADVKVAIRANVAARPGRLSARRWLLKSKMLGRSDPARGYGKAGPLHT